MREILETQRAHFHRGATRPIAARIEALKKLQNALKRHEAELLRALDQDLGKTAEEGFMTEVGVVHSELRDAMRHLRLRARPRLVRPSLAQMPGYGRVLRDPYGVVLILSPWNYPAQLALVPLIAAVAAGNCAVLRPSTSAPKTAQALAVIVRDSFLPEHVTLSLCDTRMARDLTALPFDKIFFTGSPAVGREVMRAAAENLVPVTLELGGKSPVVVAADADIPLAARRIVFGKFLNAGQTCVAPDYVLVAKSAENALLSALQAEIKRQYGDDPIMSPDLPRIVNDRHFERLSALLADARIVCGGQTHGRQRKIAPTVLTNVAEDGPVMREEIFGPILPVLPFRTMEDALNFVRARPSPLAFYLFTADTGAARRVMRDMAFGGGCVNDCVMHLASTRLPFGGVGQSGMGAYHGRAGFQCFSREKSVLVSSTRADISLRYAPRKGRLHFLRRVLR